jgi:lysophospholipase L1-like esterase
MRVLAFLAVLLAHRPAQDSPGATPKPKDAQWQKRHQGFVEEARKGGIDLLFLGDSLTDAWREGKAKAIWEARFAPYHAANFGLSGDRTQHLLWRLQNGELDGIEPRVIVLLIGTNNIGQPGPETPASAVAGIQAILHTIRAKSPKSKILLLGVFPRNEHPDHPLRAQVKAINVELSKQDDGGKTIRFEDLGPRFLKSDGTLSKEIMYDFIHLTDKGYQVWADALRDPVAQLMKD